MVFKKYKNYIIDFLVFGIPFFVEYYLTLFFHEFHYELLPSPIGLLSMKLFELTSIFVLMYIVYILSNYKKLVLSLWLLLIYIPAALNIISVYVSGFLLHEDFLVTIFNTDLKEALHSFQDYFIYILVNLIIVVYAFNRSIPQYKIKNNNCIKYAWVLLIINLTVVNFVPFKIILSKATAYYYDRKEAEEYNKAHTSLTGIKSAGGKQTYVLVIGESVDRKHMEIYGYHQPTTPYFSKIKDKIFVFKSVNTAHVFTSDAVKSILHLNISGERNYTLIHFFKDAGFKTFWISNQNGISIFDNSVTRLGKLCHESFFINNTDINARSPLDGELLPYFKNALKDKAEKKLIIIHLMGSHTPLNLRYPKEFDKFKLPENYYNKQKALYVTYYDNSILYTDYILNEILTLLKKTEDYSCMLYLSDHGSDVNDTKECEPTTRTWPNGYEIPFIIWVSDAYRNKNISFINDWKLNNHYVTDKTAYTLIDLARLGHKLISLPKNSILSPKITDKQK